MREVYFRAHALAPLHYVFVSLVGYLATVFGLATTVPRLPIYTAQAAIVIGLQPFFPHRYNPANRPKRSQDRTIFGLLKVLDDYWTFKGHYTNRPESQSS